MKERPAQALSVSATWIASSGRKMILDEVGSQSHFPSASLMRSILVTANWQEVGAVLGLSIRALKESVPRREKQVQAISNYGLVGDKHASPYSPRQLLLAGMDAYRQFDLPPAALRENLLVDSSVENLRSGDLLWIGDGVVLWMTFHCEPCNLLERRCPGTVKSIGRQRGILARILHGGEIREGDGVRILRSSIPILSDDWRSRVLKVVQAIPAQRYITYRQLAELAGVATAYCRAFPRLLSQLPTDMASRVRSGAASTAGRKWDGAELFDVSKYLEALTEQHQPDEAFDVN